MTGPYNLPLWFLRDLIFMTLLTPIIYYLIKKCNIWYILILFIAYISKIWLLIPGLHITSFFFFSTGAYFALNNINIILFTKKNKMIITISSFIFLLISIIYDGSNTIPGQIFFPIFIIAAAFSSFLYASILIEKFNFKPNKFLISSCFFIYAFHGISISGINNPLGISKKLINYIMPEYPEICYLITPFVTAFICIIIMQISIILFPKLTKIYTGNR